MDFIKAEARTDGVTTATVVSYAVDPTTPLPLGLSLDSSTGYVNGTLPNDALAGMFSYTFIASSPGFPKASLVIAVKILDKPTGGEIPAPKRILSIEFTDQTLIPSTIGVPYSDNLVARTLSDGSPDSHEVSYALADGSPELPLGLSLNSVTGFITGTIDASLFPHTVNLLFTASSPGYTPTTTALSKIIVGAVVPVALEAPVAPVAQILRIIPLGVSVIKKIVPPTKKLMMTALFANNSSTLSRTQISSIKKLCLAISKMRIKRITVFGFTNAAPGVDNQQLAIDRARTLEKYLKLNHVNQSITIKSVVADYTRANNATNSLIEMRKVELWIELG